MASTTSTTSTSLHGPWLLVMRLTWLLLAIFVFGMVIIALPGAYQNYVQASPALNEALRLRGLPAGWQVFYFLGWHLIAMLSFGVVALVIAWRKSTDWMGLFASAVCLAFGVGFSSFIFGPPIDQDILPPGLFLLAIELSRALGFIFSVVLLFVFPDGKFVPRWSRWLVLPWALWMIGGVFFPPLNISTYPIPVFMGIQMILYGVGLGMQVYRYRRVSTPAQRQQTKWVIWGIGATLVGYAIATSVELFHFSSPLQADLAWLLIHNPFYYAPRTIVAITIGLAVLRHRLWDIDFIINRSVVYGAMTVLLAAFFGVSLLVINRLFQSFASGPLVAVAFSAAAFGAVFQPARQYLKRFVDRRFYNIQIDYQKPLNLRASPPPSEGGTQIIKQTHFGEYSNLELIGRGGMAEVYRAEHPTLHRPVAIKLLPSSHATDPEFRQRFLREAQMVSRLEHSNIVRVFDYGEEQGTCYIVMEYLSGHDLRWQIDQSGHLPLAQALPILKDIAAALDYAHGMGLVHRDIKPSNVMLDEKRDADAAPSVRAVLMDFGIARVVGGQTALTSVGGIIGTFDYIAPEQIQASANVDGRADIYALGVMTFQMLTGELPFKQKNPGSLLLAHLFQPPPDARDLLHSLPVTVSVALQKSMAKKPEDRFERASEFAALVRAIDD